MWKLHLATKNITLDLVLSSGVPLRNVDPLEFSISDHGALIFRTLLLQPTHKPSCVIGSHAFNSSSASGFSEKFLVGSAGNSFNLTDTTVDKLSGPFQRQMSQNSWWICPYKNQNNQT